MAFGDNGAQYASCMMRRMPMPRRRLLRTALASAATGAPFLSVRGAPITFSADPFSLGVASGAPREDGVVLWTRLAPKPLDGGGMPNEVVSVDWLVAEDEAFARVVAHGTAYAEPALAHTVHVEVGWLRPDRVYWYRFRAGNALSPIGRTRTAPAANATPEGLRFAFASCQQYEQGYFGALRDMARRDL